MLLTKTTEIAVQCMVLLARLPKGSLITPQPISIALGSSSSYTSKILRSLAKADLLASHRGASGGFSLARPAEDITLLEVVEACEGSIVGNYCRHHEKTSLHTNCGFHQAMYEFEETVKNVLSKWTIQSISDKPLSDENTAPDCKLRRILVAERTVPTRINEYLDSPIRPVN